LRRYHFGDQVIFFSNKPIAESEEIRGDLMFSLFSLQKFKRKFFVIFILLAGFLISCDSGSGTSLPAPGNLVPNALLGRWVDPRFDDGYEIIRQAGRDLIKQFSPAMEWEGEIVSPAVDKEGIVHAHTSFSSQAGVIIVEWTVNPPVPARPFSAVYYQNLIPGTQVEMATVIVLGSWESADTATLEEAKQKFILDTRGNFIGTFGGPLLRE